MEGSIKYSTLGSRKQERKVIEKHRRNKMKFFYSQLFALVPPNQLSKGSDVSGRVDSVIEYIQALKTNLVMIKKKKDKLSSSKQRSQEHTKMINNVCKPIDIQIHEMSHDIDAVLVTGLKEHSNFCDVVWLLNEYATEVTLANFSSSGHSTFHVRQKKIGAEDICKRLKILVEGSSNVKELESIFASACNELESSLSIWDYDFQSNVWGWELHVLQ